MRLPIYLCISFALILGCNPDDDGKLGVDSGTVNDSGNADTGGINNNTLDADGTSDLAKPDVRTQDVGGPDVGAPDVGADASADQGNDAGNVCEQIGTQLEAERLAAGVCERASQCGTRYNPLCPDGGCFVHYNVNTDVAALEALEASFEAESCGSGAVCDCAAPPAQLACDNGQCGECPAVCAYTCDLPDCTCAKDACGCDQPLCVPSLPDATCAETATAIGEARDDARGCTADADCIVDTSPLCPEVGCYFVRNQNASRGEIDTLVAAYVAGGCNLTVCACTPPPAAAECVAGVCQGVAP